METLKIGLPVTPAKHLSLDIILATEILITYGGGVGGSNKTYYAIDSGTNMNDYIVLNGETVFINPEFIVTKRKVRIAKVITDTTGHSNHSKVTCECSMLTRYILLKFEELYELDAYSYDRMDAKRIIKTDLEKY